MKKSVQKHHLNFKKKDTSKLKNKYYHPELNFLFNDKKY